MEETQGMYTQGEKDCEDRAKWGPFESQGERSQEKSTLPAPWSWPSSHQLWEKLNKIQWLLMVYIAYKYPGLSLSAFHPFHPLLLPHLS